MAVRDKAEGAYHQGIMMLKRGCLSEAVACFDQTLQLDCTSIKALQQRSFALCLIGEPVRALDDCNRAIALDPGEAWSYLHRAMVQSKLQNFQSAIDDCTHALNLHPALMVAYTERGSAYCELQEYGLAIKDFTTSIELNPLDPVNYVCRAVAYDEIGKFRETIVDFSKAVELNPLDPISYFSRALAYHKIDDFENALNDYNKVLELDPEFHDARQNRCIAEDQFKQKQRPGQRPVAAVANGAPIPERKRAKVYDIFTKIEIVQD